MNDTIIQVGLDVHQDTIIAAPGLFPQRSGTRGTGEDRRELLHPVRRYESYLRQPWIYGAHNRVNR